MNGLTNDRINRLADSCLDLTDLLEVFADLMDRYPRDTAEWFTAKELLHRGAAHIRGACAMLAKETAK
jgi:hypothetical protein